LIKSFERVRDLSLSLIEIVVDFLQRSLSAAIRSFARSERKP